MPAHVLRKLRTSATASEHVVHAAFSVGQEEGQACLILTLTWSNSAEGVFEREHDRLWVIVVSSADMQQTGV